VLASRRGRLRELGARCAIKQARQAGVADQGSYARGVLSSRRGKQVWPIRGARREVSYQAGAASKRGSSRKLGARCAMKQARQAGVAYQGARREVRYQAGATSRRGIPGELGARCAMKQAREAGGADQEARREVCCEAGAASRRGRSKDRAGREVPSRRGKQAWQIKGARREHRDRHIDRHIDRHKHRGTEAQTQRHRGTHTETDTESTVTARPRRPHS
jgi:hypothetical protein